MLRSHASVCFLALGGCVRVKVLYDSVFQAPEIPVRCRQIQHVLHLSTPHLRTWYGFFFFTVPLASEVVLNGGRAGASGALVILYFYFGEYITIQSVVLTPDVFHFFILI